MSNIGFRRLLPIVFTAIQLALALYTAARAPKQTLTIVHQSGYRVVAFQEVGEMPAEPLSSSPLTSMQRAAIILNLPAFAVGGLVRELLFPYRNGTELYASIVFVPFVWYAVGRWLDGLLGYLAPMRLNSLVSGFFSLLAFGLLLLSLGGLTPLYHHRSTDSNWVFTGFILWSLLCLAITATGGERPVSG